MNELSRDDYEHAIQQWILGRNGERDRMIMSMYLFDGITYEKMLDKLEEAGYPMTKENLKKIIRKRKEQLFRHI